MTDANILSKHIVALNAVLAAVAMFMIVQTIGVFLPGFRKTEKKYVLSEPREDIDREKLPVYEDYLIIEERNLFSSKMEGSLAAQKMVVIMPTALQLKLLGTIVSGKEKSYAIIEDIEKKDQGLYDIGDTILDAEIVSIKRNEVMLKRHGRNEILYAFMTDMPAGKEAEPVIESAGTAQPAPGSSAVESIGINKWRVSKTKAIMEAGNLNNVLNELQIKPEIVDGKIRGIAVNNIGKNNILRALGVREGDVVEGVNGKGITTIQSAFEIFRSAKDSPKIGVVVKRGKKRIVLDYQLVD